MRRVNGGAWQPLAWPAGHRLAGPMDMAFQLRVGLVPAPTLTPTLTPTPYVSPSPTPEGWFTLSTSATNGVIGRSPNQSAFAPGAAVILNPRGNDGYHFAAWSGDISSTQTIQNPLSLIMDADKTIQAAFELNSHTVTTTISNGSIKKTPDTPNVPYGTLIRLEAIPSYGRLFAGWEMAVEEKEPPEYLTPAQLADPVLEFTVVEDIALRARTTAFRQCA